MNEYILDMPIVYAGRSYMVRPGTRRAKYLERASMHYNMRDYENARQLFNDAVVMPHVDDGMLGSRTYRVWGADNNA